MNTSAKNLYLFPVEFRKGLFGRFCNQSERVTGQLAIVRQLFFIETDENVVCIYGPFRIVDSL